MSDLATTREVIFACCRCNTFRQYGIAQNLHDEPENRKPVIQCAKCHKATEHVFLFVRFRDGGSERRMMSAMRTGAANGKT
jgi:hypothetical protein